MSTLFNGKTANGKVIEVVFTGQQSEVRIDGKIAKAGIFPPSDLGQRSAVGFAEEIIKREAYQEELANELGVDATSFFKQEEVFESAGPKKDSVMTDEESELSDLSGGMFEDFFNGHKK